MKFKKDSTEIAKLYTEGFDDYTGGHNGPTDGGQYDEVDSRNNAASMSVEEIVKSNISVALDQLRSPDFNGRALISHITNIFDTLDDERIQYDPYEIEPLVIQYIRSNQS